MARKKTKQVSWPEAPTDEERTGQFRPPPASMPPGLTGLVGAGKIAPNPGKEDAAEEIGWADTLVGASPTNWQERPDGTKTAGGPIKHSLCPGCRHLINDACSNAATESWRNDPNVTGCINASPRIAQ